MARDRARDALAEGEHLWRLHFARGCLDAVAEDALAVADVEDAEAAVEDTQSEVDATEMALQVLRAGTNLAQAERRAHDEVERLEAAQDEPRELSRSRYGTCTPWLENAAGS